MDHPEPHFALKDFLGLEIEQGSDSSTVSVELNENHMNPNGVAHGATPFALMDTAMGAAVMAVVNEGEMCATIEIQTRFHRPAVSGRIVAEARVLNQGRRVIHLEAKTTDDQGRLIASATASFAVLQPGS